MNWLWEKYTYNYVMDVTQYCTTINTEHNLNT